MRVAGCELREAGSGVILHITTMTDWEQAVRVGEFCPDSLAADGFIHCSTAEQMAATANRHYPGRTDMVLLVVDEGLVESEIVWEDTSGKGEDYPHIYGALNPAAVVAVVPYVPGHGGMFSTPVL